MLSNSLSTLIDVASTPGIFYEAICTVTVDFLIRLVSSVLSLLRLHLRSSLFLPCRFPQYSLTDHVSCFPYLPTVRTVTLQRPYLIQMLGGNIFSRRYRRELSVKPTSHSKFRAILSLFLRKAVSVSMTKASRCRSLLQARTKGMGESCQLVPKKNSH